jgi:hypothetical protein
MRKTVLTILGFPVRFKYTVYPGGHMEWSPAESIEEEGLFALMLRVHYAPYIEGQLRQTWFAEEYEQGQIDSAQMHFKYQDTDF